MEVPLCLVFALALFVVVAAVGAESPMEVYWKTVLGNAVMPNAITENLVPGDGQVHVARMLTHNNFYGAADLKDDTITSIFFKESDLFIGKQMYVHFRKDNAGQFLSRQAAEAIPFSSKKLPQILSHFSLKKDSTEALLMKTTLSKCEEVTAGVDQYCATSLESMIDYVTSRLGTSNLKALSSTKTAGTGKQYTIVGIALLGVRRSSLSCHKVSYLYAVFFCHQIPETYPYLVSMVGNDGTKIEAVATCHRDTFHWNEESIAFEVLKVKRGGTVCHFLGEHDVLWVRVV